MSIAESIPLVGPIIQGLTGVVTNMTNRKIAREANQLTERLSNTAHQREVKDLIEAKLNPVLSATSGMKGAVTLAAQIAKMENPLSDITNSATSAMRLSGEIDKLKADAKLSRSLSRKADEEAITQGAIRDTNNALQGKYNQEVSESKTRARQIEYSIDEILEKIDHLDEQIKSSKLGREVTKLRMERDKMFNQLFKKGNDAIGLYKNIYRDINLEAPFKAIEQLNKIKRDYHKTRKKAFKNPLKYIADEFNNALRNLKK
jgi:tetrahydromethanopterin S-methyltransferase subunit B